MDHIFQLCLYRIKFPIITASKPGAEAIVNKFILLAMIQPRELSRSSRWKFYLEVGIHSFIMPELPEVETIASDLRQSGIVGSTIVGVSVHWGRSVATLLPNEFIERLSGQTILSVSRRAKFLSFTLSQGDTLFVHLRMTGRFELVDIPTAVGEHERIRLLLNGGRALNYHDTRKFGRWFLVKDPETVIGKLGPEPLDPSFTEEDFVERLLAKTRQLKPLLLDQTFLAGLGNIYVDEALWMSKLHPKTTADSLSINKGKELLGSIRHVLERGLKAQGTTLGSGKTNFYRLDGRKGKHQDILYVFRRTGLPCPRCETPIVRIIVAQRSTHICPKCQKLF